MSEKNIVKYSNEFHKVNLNILTPVELNVFFAICSKITSEETKGNLKKSNLTIKMDFYELKEIANINQGSAYFQKKITETLSKLQSLKLQIIDSSFAETGVLFPYWKSSIEDNSVEIQINLIYIDLFVNLTKRFTRFEVSEFASLKSLYSKLWYCKMKQFRTTGFIKITLDDFITYMGIPDSYEYKNIKRRVINRILIDLGSFKEVKKNGKKIMISSPESDDMFHNLRFKEIKSKRAGQRVIGLEFRFKKEDSKKFSPKLNEKDSGYICPDCGEPLYERIISGETRFCHLDGASDNSKCKSIFNDTSDIADALSRKARKKSKSSASTIDEPIQETKAELTPEEKQEKAEIAKKYAEIGKSKLTSQQIKRKYNDTAKLPNDDMKGVKNERN